MENTIDIDKKRCETCLSCVRVCPLGIFVSSEDGVEIDRASRCIKCGHCVAACPTGAVKHGLLTLDRFGSSSSEIIPLTDLENQFRSRRSCRRFSDAGVSTDEIEKLVHSARFSPTAANAQNVRYIVLTKRESINALSSRVVQYYEKLSGQLANPLSRFFITLSQGKRTVETYRFHLATILDQLRAADESNNLFYGAPAVLIGVASGVVPIANAASNLQAMQIMLAAETMGLGTCYNGYTLTALVRDKNLREKMGVAKGSHPSSVIAVGRPDGEFKLVPPRRKQRIVWFD